MPKARASLTRSARMLRGAGMAVLCMAAVQASAAPPEAVPPRTAAPIASATTRIITLGTIGGPVARAVRSEPASLLQVGDSVYLIDAGDGVARELVKAGFEPQDIDKVFLTHLHFDHVAGLAPLIGYAWVSMQSKGIDVYGPPGTEAFSAAATQYLALPENIFVKQMPPVPSIKQLVKAHEFDVTGPSVVYNDDKVRVTAVENTHFDAMPGERPQGAKRSYSYRFDTPDRSVVFTGDTGPSDRVAELARGADVLVSEVIDIEGVMAIVRQRPGVTDANVKSLSDHMHDEHLTPEEIGRIATKAGVRMVILNHLSPALDGVTDFRSLTDGVRKTFSGPVVVSRDGGEY